MKKFHVAFYLDSDKKIVSGNTYEEANIFDAIIKFAESGGDILMVNYVCELSDKPPINKLEFETEYANWLSGSKAGL